MAELSIGDYIVLPYPADWSTVPVLRLEHRSLLSSSDSGAESRGGQWHARRRRLRYRITATNGRDAGRIEETLRVAQEAKAAAVPYWPALRWVQSVSGSTITLSAASAVPLGSAAILWWHNQQSGETGIVTIASAVGKTVTLQQVPEGLVAGAVVAPLLIGVLTSVNVTEIHGGSRSYTIEFSENIGTASGTVRSVVEALVVGLAVDGLLEDLAPERTSLDQAAFGLDLWGAYEPVVVGGAAMEAAGMALLVSGVFEQIAVTDQLVDSATLGITLSGTYT